MRIEYLGHACFFITFDNGTRLITDPYKPGAYGAIHYPSYEKEADAVTVSHEHEDHNAVSFVKGNPVVVKGTGEREIKGIKITGFPSWHDRSKGKERGKNTIFLMEESYSLIHAGDLGDIPEPSVVEELKDKDILLLPVGGTFTLGPEEAWEFAELIKPRVVIPMHYKTSFISFDLEPVSSFIQGRRHKFFGKIVHVDSLPETMEIWVMEDAG